MTSDIHIYIYMKKMLLILLRNEGLNLHILKKIINFSNTKI